jgi:predicted AAA+ superfamily ATPase
MQTYNAVKQQLSSNIQNTLNEWNKTPSSDRPRSNVYVVFGPSCSGRTTLVNELATENGLKRVNIPFDGVENIQQLRDIFDQATKNYPDGKVLYVFDDFDHTSQFVAADSELRNEFYRLLKSGDRLSIIVCNLTTLRGAFKRSNVYVLESFVEGVVPNGESLYLPEWVKSFTSNELVFVRDI